MMCNLCQEEFRELDKKFGIRKGLGRWVVVPHGPDVLLGPYHGKCAKNETLKRNREKK